MNIAQIKAVLKQNGITKAIESVGTINGTKCVILQWDGMQDYVTASTAETLQFHGFVNECEQLTIWKDENLDMLQQVEDYREEVRK